MALSDVRPFFRTRLEALGYTEWEDGFNTENIPSTILTNVFHIESGDVDGSASAHQPHMFNCSVIVRVFLKGYLSPREAVDDSYVVAEDIYADLLLPSNRLSDDVYDVIPRSLRVNPLNASNDNSVMIELEFDVKTFMKF